MLRKGGRNVKEAGAHKGKGERGAAEDETFSEDRSSSAACQEQLCVHHISEPQCYNSDKINPRIRP